MPTQSESWFPTPLAGLSTRTVRWLRSERCFYVILAILILQALWFVATARYPMAFDEDFHFGLIQLHAQQWLPFFTHQPDHINKFGPVVRDPSYIYHFLLSLPYRLITLVTANQTAQIILLRLINIALAVWGFILARQLLLKLGSSRALAHACLLIITLIPIVPFLSAHINYDNLFIPLTILSLLWTFRWIDAIGKGQVSLIRTLTLLSLFMLTSLVKYAFLPVAIGLGIVLLWHLWQQRSHWDRLWFTLRQSAVSSPRWLMGVATVVCILSAGLFAERYVINVIRYHSPNPDCAQVLTTVQCLSYGPWARDYYYAQNKPADQHTSKIAYIWQWPFGLWFRSFFAISDTYDTQFPLPVPGAASVLLAVTGIVLILCYRRRILDHHTYRRIVLFAILLYLAALFLQTFQGYLRTGEPIAINGRYLLPFMPAIVLFMGLAMRELWRHKPAAKAVTFLCSIALLAYGGGALTFLLRSQDSWYWQNNVIITTNHVIRETVSHVVVGSGYQH